MVFHGLGDAMNTDRGLFRLYIVFAICWGGWFGYQFFDANKQYDRAGMYLETIRRESAAGKPSAYIYSDTVVWQNEQSRRAVDAGKFGIWGLIGGLVLLFVSRWVVSGFNPKDKTPQATPYLDKRVAEIEQNKLEKQESKFKKGSTLGLVLSIVVFPIAWMIDPGAMSNYWVSRNKDK